MDHVTKTILQRIALHEELGAIPREWIAIADAIASNMGVSDAVPIPKNADQAAGMAIVGHAWLKEHAPERLAAAPRAAQERIQEQASALRQIARLANAQLRRPDEPSTALPDAPCRLTEEANRIAALPEAETVNTMLWLYRRIPKAYGRLPFVEKEIRSLAAKLGMNVEALLAERAALPEDAE